MSRSSFSKILFVLGALAALQMAAARSSSAIEPTATETAKAGAQVEVLTRGPVHEAFMTQINLNPALGITAPKEPPPAIEELPPEFKPAGEHVVWIPGYWTWDDESQDYLWMSGAWRAPPPRHRWVPGYWNKRDNGFQWVSGFWLAADVGQLAYQAAPPKSVERGPNSEPPSANHFWAPGSWEPSDGKYKWRAGNWVPQQQNWIWIPSQNYTTAHGTIHSPGYWDYRLHERGQLFAPLRIGANARSSGNLRVTPSQVIADQQLLLHLFVRPQSGQYLFGDYYDAKYAKQGIQSWFNYHASRGGYDPHFAYYNWYYGRGGNDYLNVLQGWHKYFLAHDDLRPPRTLAAQLDFIASHQDYAQLGQTVMGNSLTDIVANTSAATSFVRLDAASRLAINNSLQQLRLLGTQRLNLESAGLGAVNVPTQILRLPAAPALPLPTNVAPVPGNPLEILNQVPDLPTGELNLPGLPF